MVMSNETLLRTMAQTGDGEKAIVPDNTVAG
jgi:hypothetical protein